MQLDSASMTPGARVAAAIEIIDQIDEAGAPADSTVERYFRARRYAGSKDRRAITARIFDLVRHRARLDWWGLRIQDNQRPSGRRRIIAELMLSEGLDKTAVLALFDGTGYGPAPLSRHEEVLVDGLAGETLNHPDQPDWVAHEYPAWLSSTFEDLYGGRLGEELDAFNMVAPLDLRVNTLKCDCTRALEVLKNDGISAEPTSLSPIGLRIEGRANLAGTTAFKGGFIEVQDEGSQIIALLTAAEKGMAVTDFCAGAGGKTLAIAVEMGDDGVITACDIDPKRLDQIKPRLKRAKCRSIKTQSMMAAGDLWVLDNEGTMDRVLVDVPCSGTGRWRRRPDARWRLSGNDVREVAKDQRRILFEAARLVKPGGRLIYATCSILPQENEAQVANFIDWFKDFHVLPIGEVWAETVGGPCPAGEAEFLRLTPASNGTDGFFVAVLERDAG